MGKVWRGLFKLFAFLGLLAAYFFLYLFPSLAQINRQRREASDFDREIKKYNGFERGFSPLDRREESLLAEVKRLVRDSLLLAESTGGGNAAFSLVRDFIQACAKTGRIAGIGVAPAPASLRPERGIAISTAMKITFSADPAAAFRFFRCITSSSFPLQIESLNLSSDGGRLEWEVGVALYSRGSGFSGISSTRFPVDLQSPILLQPLPSEVSPAYEGAEGGEACRLNAFRRPGG